MSGELNSWLFEVWIVPPSRAVWDVRVFRVHLSPRWGPGIADRGRRLGGTPSGEDRVADLEKHSQA